MSQEQPAGLPLEHYFAERPRVASTPRLLRFLYHGDLLTVETDRGVFASHGLDPGTSLLIEHLEVGDARSVLDVGCGWGALGLAAAKSAPGARVLLTDVNQRAVRLARRNLERNQVRNAEVRAGNLFEPVGNERFDLIVSHPPFHAGREVVERLLLESLDHLSLGGRLLIVGKNSQGIRFYQSWLGQLSPGSVTVLGRGSGYRVLESRPSAAARHR
jgi:16S rRNA (guanine1207-N2)-methyltransferase